MNSWLFFFLALVEYRTKWIRIKWGPGVCLFRTLEYIFARSNLNIAMASLAAFLVPTTAQTEEVHSFILMLFSLYQLLTKNQIQNTESQPIFSKLSQFKREEIARPSSYVSTIHITAMGCQQCLPLSVVQLKGKHCQKLHYRNGVVDRFRPGLI